MLDSNSKAELDRDAPLTHKQKLQIIEENEEWERVRDSLLDGNVEKNAFGQEFTLENRLAEEYVVFNQWQDSGYDYITMYKNGELHPKVRRVIKREAGILASIVVG